MAVAGKAGEVRALVEEALGRLAGPRTRAGVVSVVIVNYKGLADTLECLDGLAGLDWPTRLLEVVVVDNASGGDEAAAIRRHAPTAIVVESEVNTGFAGGCNLGVSKAHGEYVALLNNDARPAAGWLAAAVAAFEAEPGVACIGSKVLDWEGRTIDFVDSAMSFYGQAFKLHVGTAVEDVPDEDHDILFASGAAALFRTSVFREVGGFDERYFMFFEDVDLGWRLWLLGHTVRYVPGSVVFHKHHASMERFGVWREHYLLERNALFTIYKHYDDEHLAAFLPAALALAVRRGVVLGGDDADALDLSRHVDGDSPRLEVSKETLAPVFAIDAFVRAMPGLAASRAALQAQRTRSDAEITRLFRLPLHANLGEPAFKDSYDAVVEAMDVGRMFSRRRILVATGDSLTPAMAGPAIRAWQIAQALSLEHDVVLATTTKAAITHPRFDVRLVTGGDLVELERWADVIVFQGYILHENAVLRKSRKVVLCDIYDPFHLEQLEQARDLGETDRRSAVSSSTAVLNSQLLRGDFFTCASEKQRDFWLGQLAALGRINTLTYDEDETMESLLGVVPFGVSDNPPIATRPMVRDVIPGIGPDDKVILWGGGVYNWFDPLTLIRGIHKLSEKRDDLRLVFMGMKHPNPAVPEMRMAVQTRALADQLGMTGATVFFNEEWVQYDERQNFLLESDIGASTHLDHVETAFSYRTRILDYIWASLPVLCTKGDSLARLVEDEGLGLTVAAGDVDAVADAIDRLLDPAFRAECQSNLRRVAPSMTWSVALKPMLDFCRNPRRAPDLLDPEVRGGLNADLATPKGQRSGVRHDVNVALYYVRSGGVLLVVRKVAGRIKRLVA